MKKHKVLSVEYNIAHDVIRPSIYKHFKELGYQVDFLLAETENKKRWNFFTRINDTINTTTATYDEMDEFLTSDKVKEYDFIIFNTSFSFMSDFKNIDIPITESIRKNTDKYPKPKYGCLTIPPHVSGYFNKKGKCKLKNRKLSIMYVLNHVGYGKLPMLSANYFGEIKITPKTDKNIFLATGNISAQKNHKLLIIAAEKLVRENLTNFKIVVNGIGDKLDIPEHLNQYFEFLGDNQPDKLFEIIENCDFITALLDSTMEWQRNQYGHGTCSCALMYSMGFSKPLLIENYFTKNYGLNNKNSIIYDGQDLYSAMKQAILMQKSEYMKMQNNIKDFSNQWSQKTLYDLSRTLNTVKLERLRKQIFSIEKDSNNRYITFLSHTFKTKRHCSILKFNKCKNIGG